ncbi:MAG: (Fe-S)-binding protein [Deltaproteobacteria bacterium]|nr:(Fe-S)-binding protein [Deltaproteobacteria bacterium]
MESRFNISEDLYTAMHKCIRCGQCVYGNEDARFSPMQIKAKYFTYSAGGIMQIARAIYEGKMGFSEPLRDLLFHCTTCGACEINCGVIGSQVDLFTLLKRELAKNGIPLLEPHKSIVENVLSKKNIYEGNLPGRTDWLSDEEKESMSSNPEVFYHVGCISSYMEKEIPNAFVSVLTKLEIPFAINNDEWCCGAPLYFAGYEEETYDLAKHNVEAIEKSGASKVVFTCPTCAMIFKNYYPRWVKRPIKFEILHATEFFERLQDKGKLKLGPIGTRKTVTYHDPCHLGRGQGVYDAPRRILNAIEDLDFKEFSLSRENSLCCGGGGLVPTGFPDFADDLARIRVSDMKNMGADLLVTACPACKENMKIAVKKLKRGAKVSDITELIDQALQ